MANEAPVHRVRIVLVSRAERIIEPSDDSNYHPAPNNRERPLKTETPRRTLSLKKDQGIYPFIVQRSVRDAFLALDPRTILHWPYKGTRI